MKNVAIEVGTSIADEIKYMVALGTAYVMFPSIDSAQKVLYKLQGKLSIQKTILSIDFYPTNLAKNNPNQSNVNFV